MPSIALSSVDVLVSVPVNMIDASDEPLAENAAISLGNYGAKAAIALPELESAQRRSGETVRKAATNAIARIKALAQHVANP